MTPQLVNPNNCLPRIMMSQMSRTWSGATLHVQVRSISIAIQSKLEVEGE
jgi:hypothetical protein